MRIDNNINTNEISIAKGIGIILMVVGHSGCPPFLRDYIYMFHMPLFFIISGYCFKNKYLSDFKTFANKRIIGLYFPFVKYGVLFVLLHNLFYRIGVFNADYGSGIASEFFNIKSISMDKSKFGKSKPKRAEVNLGNNPTIKDCLEYCCRNDPFFKAIKEFEKIKSNNQSLL